MQNEIKEKKETRRDHVAPSPKNSQNRFREVPAHEQVLTPIHITLEIHFACPYLRNNRDRTVAPIKSRERGGTGFSRARSWLYDAARFNHRCKSWLQGFSIDVKVKREEDQPNHESVSATAIVCRDCFYLRPFIPSLVPTLFHPLFLFAPSFSQFSPPLRGCNGARCTVDNLVEERKQGSRHRRAADIRSANGTTLAWRNFVTQPGSSSI